VLGPAQAGELVSALADLDRIGKDGRQCAKHRNKVTVFDM